MNGKDESIKERKGERKVYVQLWAVEAIQHRLRLVFALKVIEYFNDGVHNLEYLKESVRQFERERTIRWLHRMPMTIFE